MPSCGARRRWSARTATTCGLAIGGRALDAFGSQGQQRTAVLALKVAEYETMRARTGDAPILLLDDVLSELDAERAGGFLARGRQLRAGVPHHDRAAAGSSPHAARFRISAGDDRRMLTRLGSGAGRLAAARAGPPDDPLATIRAAWAEIVGADVARAAQPVALQRHGAGRRHLLGRLEPPARVPRARDRAQRRRRSASRTIERLRFRVGTIRAARGTRRPAAGARRRERRAPAGRPRRGPAKPWRVCGTSSRRRRAAHARRRRNVLRRAAARPVALPGRAAGRAPTTEERKRREQLRAHPLRGALARARRRCCAQFRDSPPKPTTAIRRRLLRRLDRRAAPGAQAPRRRRPDRSRARAQARELLRPARDADRSEPARARLAGTTQRAGRPVSLSSARLRAPSTRPRNE